MLFEDAIIDAVIDYLGSKGYRIIQRSTASQQGYDLVAEKDAKKLYVEAKGQTSSKPGTKRYGKEFNSGQKFDHVAKAVLKAIQAINQEKIFSPSYPKGICMESKPDSKVISPKEIIIPPDKPFTGQRALTEIIEKSEGHIWVLDSYVDEKTLDLLHNAPEGIPIRLLTCNTGGADKKRRFLRACKNLKVERPGFEIRKGDSKLIHDRFILTKNKGWMIGASLKDTGKKLTMITEMSHETSKQTRSHFEEIWKKSSS